MTFMVADLFPGSGTRARLNALERPTLMVSGPDLCVSVQPSGDADPDFLAFIRSLHDAAGEWLRAYEATFTAEHGSGTAPAA
jgi:hypothetical protein